MKKIKDFIDILSSPWTLMVGVCKRVCLFLAPYWDLLVWLLWYKWKILKAEILVIKTENTRAKDHIEEAWEVVAVLPNKYRKKDELKKRLNLLIRKEVV